MSISIERCFYLLSIYLISYNIYELCAIPAVRIHDTFRSTACKQKFRVIVRDTVPDPWHFGADPDPRITASDEWIWILLFSSLTYKTATKTNFLKVFCLLPVLFECTFPDPDPDPDPYLSLMDPDPEHWLEMVLLPLVNMCINLRIKNLYILIRHRR
jgi:hypothetical protein